MGVNYHQFIGNFRHIIIKNIMFLFVFYFTKLALFKTQKYFKNFVLTIFVGTKQYDRSCLQEQHPLTSVVKNNVIRTNVYIMHVFRTNVFRTNVFRTNVFRTNVFRANVFRTNVFRKLYLEQTALEQRA
jgi:hypothetical protein